jgi:Tfp pilus assembly protein PilZ
VTWRYEPRPGEAQRAPGLGVEFTDETGTNRLAREIEEYDA